MVYKCRGTRNSSMSVSVSGTSVIRQVWGPEGVQVSEMFGLSEMHYYETLVVSNQNIHGYH